MHLRQFLWNSNSRRPNPFFFLQTSHTRHTYIHESKHSYISIFLKKPVLKSDLKVEQGDIHFTSPRPYTQTPDRVSQVSQAGLQPPIIYVFEDDTVSTSQMLELQELPHCLILPGFVCARPGLYQLSFSLAFALPLNLGNNYL